MKNKFKTVLFGILFLGITITNAQISTSTGGVANVLPNVPTTNTNVGIGTTNPTAKLEVVGDVKTAKIEITNSQPNGSVFVDWKDRNKKCTVLNAGTLRDPLDNGRVLWFLDLPQSNLDTKSISVFGIDDRSNSTRFSFWGQQGGYTNLNVYNKSQEELMKLYEDGSNNVYLQFGKPNSRVVIGGFSDNPNSLGHKLFVQGGSAKIEGNILTDSNIGIGTNTPLARLQVDGDISSTGTNQRIGFNTNDKFTNASSTIAHYGMSISRNAASQPIVSHSGYFGINFFTVGAERMRITEGGNVGVGTLNPDSKLTVNGTIHATEVKVTQTVPADYVFEKYYLGKSSLNPNYKLLTLSEIEKFTKENHHLPNVPSAKDIKENGLQLGEMSKIQQEKIEELTLYLIQQNAAIEELKLQVKALLEKKQ
jgi:hypothetical protein